MKSVVELTLMYHCQLSGFDIILLLYYHLTIGNWLKSAQDNFTVFATSCEPIITSKIEY